MQFNPQLQLDTQEYCQQFPYVCMNVFVSIYPSTSFNKINTVNLLDKCNMKFYIYLLHLDRQIESKPSVIMSKLKV